ncbi:hypothetical protein MTO96_043820 [Rhipicephalus appendiculatus]
MYAGDLGSDLRSKKPDKRFLTPRPPSRGPQALGPRWKSCSGFGSHGPPLYLVPGVLRRRVKRGHAAQPQSCSAPWTVQT